MVILSVNMPATIKHLRIHPTCKRCNSTCNLFTCKGCSAVQYCSLDHEKDDLKEHGPVCAQIQERMDAIQECERLILHPGQFPSAGGIAARLVSRRDSTPGPGILGSLRRAEEVLRGSVFKMFVRENTHASLTLAIKQLPSLVQHITALQPISASILLKMGADRLCYNILSIAHRITVYRERRIATEVMLQEFELEAQRIMEEQELGCDVLEDLRQWIFQPPLPTPESMATLVLLLHLWIEDLEKVVQFDHTFANILRTRLNYDVVEIIKGYLFDTEVLAGNKKVLQSRTEDLLDELKQRQEDVLKTTYHSQKRFWDQLILELNLGANPKQNTISEGSGEVPFSPSPSNQATFASLFLADSSAFQMLSDFLTRERARTQ
ncbi:hypothetical protein TWF730_003803 [Orbilia blumenaviensis]|uniref:MYND-type domain-containing protein n=1 Tax=Orbilia blumenaviensis TaxID=1796055 RepID=A0AAV9U4S1_9PEZI